MPQLGNPAEQTPGVGKLAKGMPAGELTLPPASRSIEQARLSSAGELAPEVQIRKNQQGDQLSYHWGQGQIQGSELAHPKIYINCELLEQEEGPVLRMQTGRISMTQGNNRTTRRSPD